MWNDWFGVLIQVVAERDNVVAYLCGDGPLRGRLQSVVDDRGLGDRLVSWGISLMSPRG